MDTFFRRHFRRRAGGVAVDDEGAGEFGHGRRPSIAVATSRARRRSSAGLPSAGLAQRRRSSVQLQGALHASRGVLLQAPRGQQSVQSLLQQQRRRSSTTTPRANPRFAVRRKRGGAGAGAGAGGGAGGGAGAGGVRGIHSHLLGPSLLLASLIQMSEEDETVTSSSRAETAQVELRPGIGPGQDDNESDVTASQSEESDGDWGGGSEVEVSDREFEDTATWSAASPWQQRRQSQPLAALMECVPSRPLIRAPRCLRRNSSLIVAANGYGYRGSQGRRRRRVSTVSKAGSPWPGRGVPLPNRRNSLSCRRMSGCHGNISPSLGVAGYYDPQLESWEGFLS